MKRSRRSMRSRSAQLLKGVFAQAPAPSVHTSLLGAIIVQLSPEAPDSTLGYPQWLWATFATLKLCDNTVVFKEILKLLERNRARKDPVFLRGCLISTIVSGY